MSAAPLPMPSSKTPATYSAPNRLVLKLALGEAPGDVPSTIDVRLGARAAVKETGHGPIDRLLREMGGGARIALVHSAAAALGNPGSGNLGFSDLEHVIGLSRTFAIELAEPCHIDELVNGLRQLSMVQEASPHYLSTLPFAMTAAPVGAAAIEAWHTRDLINAPEALAYEPGDKAVIVAVCDTGVRQEHPELHDRLRSGMSTVELDAAQLAVGVTLLSGPPGDTDDSDPEDRVGHGTGCAGIIGAQGDRIPPGMAGDCSMLPIQVLGAAQFVGRTQAVGVGAIPDIDMGVKNSVDFGARVINMSFGTPASALGPFDPKPHADVVAYALARGCILIAASGNSGQEEEFLPAAYDGVIAVGAVSRDGQPTPFSTRGEHVALAAPGERVVTCGLDGYQLATGTSFAAPFVTGAVALMMSRAGRRTPPMALDAATVRHILAATARPWPAGTERGNGTGVLDVLAALRHLDREITRLTEQRHAARRAAHSSVAAGGMGL